MTETLKPDICIIGGGAAGVAAAIAAARAGASAVLVEKRRMGGAHLHAGSVTAHALCAAAAKAAAFADAETFGIGLARPKIDLFQVREHLHRAVAAVAPDYAAQRLRGMGVAVIERAGMFLSPDTLDADECHIKAGAFVVATGSMPKLPAIDGLSDSSYLTHETLFDQTVLPRHLVMLGGEPHDLPVAQAYRRLGAEVTVVTEGPLLPVEDPEAVAVLRNALAADGVRLLEGVVVRSVQRGRGKVAVTLDSETIDASQVLVAGPRRPAADGLGLGAAKASRGGDDLLVDGHFKTANSRIYAVGDAGGGRTSQEAKAQAARVIAAIKGGAADQPAGVEVRVVHTDPPLVHAGLTEADAKARRIDAAILRFAFADNDRAAATRRPAGHVKAVVAPTGRILGVTIVGARADDLIAPWMLAIANGLDIAAIAALALPYPTFAEAAVEAARGFTALGLTPSRLKRMMGRMRP